jgi:hypothetical protein
MIRTVWWMLLLVVAVSLLAGCTQPQPPQVPARLQVCPDAVYAPPPPPSPRTVKALFVWAGKIEVARQHSEAARLDCSRRLDALNLWILRHRP